MKNLGTLFVHNLLFLSIKLCCKISSNIAELIKLKNLKIYFPHYGSLNLGLWPICRPCQEENTARAVISTRKFICVCNRTCKKISTYGQRGSRINAKEEKHTIEVRLIEKNVL